MADDTADGANIPDGTKQPKRRLRTGPETVHERTEKLQKQSEDRAADSRGKAFLKGFLWPLRKLGHLIGKLGRFRIFRWIGYVLLPPYIRNSWRELKLVSWPDRRKTFQLTYAVIIFSVIFGLLIAAVDFGLDKLFKELIVK